MIEVILQGMPSIDVNIEAKVIDSYKQVDSSLSTTSENPVMNKIVTEELNKKAAKEDVTAALNSKADNEEVNAKLTELSAEINGADVVLSLGNDAFTRQGFITKNGFTQNAGYLCTELIDVTNAKKIELKNVYANEYGVLGYALYAADAITIISSNEIPTTAGWLNATIAEVPVEAKFLVCCRLPIEPIISSIEITSRQEGLKEEVEKIKNELNQTNNASTSFRYIDETDVEFSNDGFVVSDKSIKKNNKNGRSIIYFKENIKAIEFEVGDLLDASAMSLIFGIGMDGNSNNCIAFAWVPSNKRNETVASVRNATINDSLTISNEQTTSICGVGRFSSPYRNPESLVKKYDKGDVCRIEILDKGFIKGSIKTDNGWEKWFTCDTQGAWLGGANRLGWNQGLRLGFVQRFASTSTGTIAKNIKVINDSKDEFISFCYNSTIAPNRGKWLAIGDSITAINDNNGLSYVGFASRLYGFDAINKGQGGWTLYRYWRDRDGWYRAADGTISQTSGTFNEGNHWQEAVGALPSGSIVSILMGTNDFDTTFITPSNDEDMDKRPDPHPRFGTIDPLDADAKNSHTTLGCLRLIIERIYELNPNVKVAVFAPFYRTKKGVENGQFTEMLVNADGKTIYDYADAIVKVASEYNVPTFNTCRECGINKFTLETYTYDNLHINEQGGELIGKYVGSRLANL